MYRVGEIQDGADQWARGTRWYSVREAVALDVAAWETRLWLIIGTT
jgi:hypothetical protein